MRRSPLLSSTSLGLGMGLGLMYFLDPQRGRRRRRLAQDQAVHLRNQSSRTLIQGVKHVAFRTQGAWSHLRSTLNRNSEPPSNEVLVARVRSKIGRVTSHPHAIQVSAREGRITLQGSILESEVDPVIHAIQRVPGVQQIQPQFHVFSHSEGVPELQGSRRSDSRSSQSRIFGSFFNAPQSQHTRILLGITGAASVTYSLLLQGQEIYRRWRLPLLIGGAFFLLRSLSPSLSRSKKTLQSIPSFQFSFHQTIHLNVPLQETFSFLSRVENFEKFVTRLQEVRNLGEGRSYWRIQGPLRLPLSWISEVVQFQPQKKIAWSSLSDAHIQNSGQIQFYQTKNESTQIEFEFHYNPPFGLFGLLLSQLLRFDPKNWIQQSLIQMKQALEHEYLQKKTQMIQKTGS